MKTTLQIVTAVLLCLGFVRGGVAQGQMVISPAEISLAEAVQEAEPGQEIVLEAGTYAVQNLVIEKPVSLIGKKGAVLDGGGEHILLVKSDSVSVRGLSFKNVGTSFVEDRAAIKMDGAKHCVIKGNTFEDTFFAIYLARTAHCVVKDNIVQGHKASESRSGNAIHLWYSRYITVTDNEVRGHRDGIYLEFVEDSKVMNNISENNMRYGLHFMFSDRCSYENNILRNNDAGVAVMYTENVNIINNVFEGNWGTAAYGLLLKDISDAEIKGNVFNSNTIGIYAEGSNRMLVSHNDFIDNGWAIKVMANVEENRYVKNNFISNSFDVATNSRYSDSEFSGNYWDKYQGYDLDRDGVGDVPFRPVRLYSLLIEQNEPVIILMNSFFIELLDAAERILPALTPDALVDTEPATEEIL